jgi:hypothetical protein
MIEPCGSFWDNLGEAGGSMCCSFFARSRHGLETHVSQVWDRHDHSRVFGCQALLLPQKDPLTV